MSPAPQTRIAAGSASLAPDEVRVVPLPPGHNRHPREALLVRDHGGRLRAYVNICQHLPVPLDGGSRVFLTRNRQQLECGTHGARYRLEDGYCVHGPCRGRSLPALSVECEGDEVYLCVDG